MKGQGKKRWNYIWTTARACSEIERGCATHRIDLASSPLASITEHDHLGGPQMPTF